MSASLATARTRLEIQGFVGLSDEEVRKFNYWLRTAPAICLVWIVVGVINGSPLILSMLVPFELLGGITKGHPFDVIYNHGIRHILGLPVLPEYGTPRRFAFGMASTMTAITATLLGFGLNAFAYILGGMMILVASLQVATGLCGPALIYRLLCSQIGCKVEQKFA